MPVSEIKKAVLRFGYRQGILLPATVSKRFFNNKAVDRLFRDLEAERLIVQMKRSIASRYNYALLDKRGYKAINLDAQSPTSLTETRLNQRIGLAWFCSMESHKRHVLFAHELRARFKDAVSTKYRHVITNEFSCPAVLRVYHATGSNRASRDHVRSFLREHRSKEGIGTDVASGTYGIAVLAPSKVRAAEISAALDDAGLFGRLRLIVGLGPTAETFSDCMSGRRSAGTSEEGGHFVEAKGVSEKSSQAKGLAGA